MKRLKPSLHKKGVLCGGKLPCIHMQEQFSPNYPMFHSLLMHLLWKQMHSLNTVCVDASTTQMIEFSFGSPFTAIPYYSCIFASACLFICMPSTATRAS